MFAGQQARDLVFKHMNSIENVTNLQSDAHTCYDNLRWGIEARQEGQKYVPAATCTWYTLTRFIKVKYIYRRVPYSSKPGPAGNTLRDGDEIRFGGGVKGERLGSGPLPLLCNVQLAVARILQMSGAAEVVVQLNRDADDSDYPHVYVASNYFRDILHAKLLLQSVQV
jgi:hypothetical protein